MASQVLSIAVKQVTKDWVNEYCYAPVLFETFVDTENFRGTCYKAANWTYVGKTAGGVRVDRLKDTGSRKDIYMYPVNKKFKEILRGEISYEVINPDE